jgi:hypothetical protein
LPVQIGGRNRVWRDMVVDDLRNDPGYAGNYDANDMIYQFEASRDYDAEPAKTVYRLRASSRGRQSPYCEAATRGVKSSLTGGSSARSSSYSACEMGSFSALRDRDEASPRSSISHLLASGRRSRSYRLVWSFCCLVQQQPLELPFPTA